MWCQNQCHCWTSFWLSWLNKCSGATDDAISITWWWCWYQWHHMTKKVMFISFWSSGPKSGMVPLMTLLAWCDSDTSIISFPWPKDEWCHWQYCRHHETLTAVSQHYMTKTFYYTFLHNLDLMNTVLLLTMALASHHTDASANSVKWLKKWHCISFQSSWTNTVAVLLMMPAVSCNANTGII